jgi:prepilin-type N-terminal cleavage/methylation domain-containing protein
MEIVIIMKKGFTLAEVLITLGIVGVVASLTLPNLITKYQKFVTVQQLKKGYSMFLNAFQFAEDTYGPISTWDELYDANGWAKSFDHVAFFDKYLKQSIGAYEYKTRPESIYPIKNLNDNDYGYGVLMFKNEKWFYVKDGSCFSFRTGSYYWQYIFYDINGDKKPNTIGKDIFVMGFGSSLNYKLRFEGAGKYSNPPREEILSNGCKRNSNGYYNAYYCGYLIQIDGWQIKDDYPW